VTLEQPIASSERTFGRKTEARYNVLMPPQSNPSSPNPEYDFIMNSGQTAPKQSKLPMPKLPKLALLFLGVVVALILAIIIVSVLGSTGKTDTKPYIDIMSRSTEIIRVNDLAKKDLRDADTLALLTTANAALASDQAQFGLYLGSLGQEVKPELLTAYLNNETDKGIETATQNNSLEEAYVTYLKGSLDGYLGALKSTQQNAGPNAKAIITGSIASTEALLAAPQFHP